MSDVKFSAMFTFKYWVNKSPGGIGIILSKKRNRFLRLKRTFQRQMTVTACAANLKTALSFLWELRLYYRDWSWCKIWSASCFSVEMLPEKRQKPASFGVLNFPSSLCDDQLAILIHIFSSSLPRVHGERRVLSDQKPSAMLISLKDTKEEKKTSFFLRVRKLIFVLCVGKEPIPHKAYFAVRSGAIQHWVVCLPCFTLLFFFWVYGPRQSNKDFDAISDAEAIRSSLRQFLKNHEESADQYKERCSTLSQADSSVVQKLLAHTASSELIEEGTIIYIKKENKKKIMKIHFTL